MILNNQTLQNRPVLTERVLQFGTGVLLRGLCDFAIDKANKAGIFNGSVVVVKSTPGSVENFKKQDNLYTVCIRGLKAGKPQEENVVCEAISRVLVATDEWEAILETALSPEMNVVISNTTEVGLQYYEETIGTECPKSFPAKLTAWLKKRFDAGLEGVVIVPTELVVDNGKLLQSFVTKHAQRNNLGDDFINWLKESCSFCDSLVDRIVPGRPAKDELPALFGVLGYEDELVLKCESYKLWAIEGDEKVANILSFEDADKDIIVAKDITQYRELKLRVLNASHTLMCGLSYLSGFEFVKDALKDEMMEKYITILMLTEMAPAIPYEIDAKIAQRYGRDVMDRFRNPYLEHKWLSITLQYTMKMKNRVIPILYKYYEVFDTVPQYLARCFAAYLLFMKATKKEGDKYYGNFNGTDYHINCDQAAYFHELWRQDVDTNELVSNVLSNEELWGTDLTQLEEFSSTVATHLGNMKLLGAKEVASALNVFA